MQITNTYVNFNVTEEAAMQFGINQICLCAKCTTKLVQLKLN